MIVFSQPIEQFPYYAKVTNLPVMTNVDAAFPAANLLTYDPTQVARTTTGSTVITWDLGVAKNLNTISLINSNASHRATLKIEGSLNNAAWTTLVDGPFWAQLAVVPGAGPYAEDIDPRKGSFERNPSWYYSANLLNFRYLRLTIADPLIANLTFGRLFVGKAFKPRINYQYGSSFDFSDTGTKDRTDQGAKVLLPGRPITGATVRMDFYTSAEFYDIVYEFNYWRQSCREILVCLDIDNIPRLNKNILYATIEEGRRIEATYFNTWAQTWALESI